MNDREQSEEMHADDVKKGLLLQDFTGNVALQNRITVCSCGQEGDNTAAWW